jgi:predicted Na+-dependent transporter
LKLEESACRTISIEVGMQNSGLGAVLAQTSFAQMALAPVPAAISASFHSIIGSLFAAWWRLKPAGNGHATIADQIPAPACFKSAGTDHKRHR